jgi:peptide chain release factor 1
MDKMFDRLIATETRYKELEDLLASDEVISNLDEYKKLSKEKSNIEDIVEKYNEYKKLEHDIEDLEVLKNDEDEEMAEMARLELENALPKKDLIIEELKKLLAPKDPLDDRNVIVEIRGAAGGDEANIFAGDLFRMYTRYSETNDWKVEVLDVMEGTAGGYSLVSFRVKGDKVYSKLKYESGAHRVQRVPKTESQGRIHTSTATVLVMPEAEDVDVNINPSDLRIDTYRASGAGGQHINKTDSAIRITHIPTGIVAECQDGRSQHDNRAQAMIMIRTRVLDAMIQKQESERHKERQSKIGSGDRSEKIRTYNYPQNRVTDHRIGLTIQSLDRIMEGELENVVSSLINEDLRLKLEGQEL